MVSLFLLIGTIIHQIQPSAATQPLSIATTIASDRIASAVLPTSATKANEVESPKRTDNDPATPNLTMVTTQMSEVLYYFSIAIIASDDETKILMISYIFVFFFLTVSMFAEF